MQATNINSFQGVPSDIYPFILSHLGVNDLKSFSQTDKKNNNETIKYLCEMNQVFSQMGKEFESFKSRLDSKHFIRVSAVEDEVKNIFFEIYKNIKNDKKELKIEGFKYKPIHSLSSQLEIFNTLTQITRGFNFLSKNKYLYFMERIHFKTYLQCILDVCLPDLLNNKYPTFHNVLEDPFLNAFNQSSNVDLFMVDVLKFAQEHKLSTGSVAFLFVRLSSYLCLANKKKCADMIHKLSSQPENLKGKVVKSLAKGMTSYRSYAREGFFEVENILVNQYNDLTATPQKKSIEWDLFKTRVKIGAFFTLAIVGTIVLVASIAFFILAMSTMLIPLSPLIIAAIAISGVILGGTVSFVSGVQFFETYCVETYEF